MIFPIKVTDIKPNNIDKIWTEKELAERLGLPVSKSGRSTVLGNWIKDGLTFVDKGERRYFFEADVIEYIWCKRTSVLSIPKDETDLI